MGKTKPLLERARAVNKILSGIANKPVNYTEMAEIMCENLGCSAFIISKRGEVGGYALTPGFKCQSFFKQLEDKKRPFPMVSPEFAQTLLSVQETNTNIKLDEKCVFDYEHKNEGPCECSDYIWAIHPTKANGGSRRLGSLLLCNENQEFSEDDIVLAEYSSLVVSMEVMRALSEHLEEDARKKAAVQVALATLSYSEREAIEHIMAELAGEEGLLVASRIADKVGITRSVIVSALRKFESAGVIESRSLGMKGTYIKVLNPYVFKALSGTN
ncbi:MAG: GTP-sensing pleiotropic transcriptional regulator CodY [Syntrophomonadaceae bacterium]|nr:GTP-sensing pleiotropic transcriptional regulator CodY [Syntrophomonadaceae bacterium]